MKQERNNLIDIVRGLGIITVCVFHLIYRTENGFADKLIMSGIWLVIPLFFAISGYLHAYSHNHNLSYRIKALLIPSINYTLFLLITGGVYCVMFHGYTFRDCLRDSVLTYLRPEFSLMLLPKSFIPADYWTFLLYDIISPVWFIWTMLFVIPVFYVLADYSCKCFRNLFICCVMLLAVSFLLYDYSNYFSWSLTLVPCYAAVMLAGAYCSGKVLNLRNYYFAVIALVLHFAMFVMWGSSSAFMNVLGTAGRFSVIIFFVQVFIGGYAFMTLCTLLVRTKYIAEFLAFTGRNSLLFMFLHRPFAVIFSDIMGTYIKSGNFWYVEFTPEVFIKSVIIFALSMTCCSVIALVINTEGRRAL